MGCDQEGIIQEYLPPPLKANCCDSQVKTAFVWGPWGGDNACKLVTLILSALLSCKCEVWVKVNKASKTLLPLSAVHAECGNAIKTFSHDILNCLFILFGPWNIFLFKEVGSVFFFGWFCFNTGQCHNNLFLLVWQVTKGNPIYLFTLQILSVEKPDKFSDMPFECLPWKWLNPVPETKVL